MDRQTDRQTECINTFQLCWKVLKKEEEEDERKKKKKRKRFHIFIYKLILLESSRGKLLNLFKCFKQEKNTHKNIFRHKNIL